MSELEQSPSTSTVRLPNLIKTANAHQQNTIQMDVQKQNEQQKKNNQNKLHQSILNQQHHQATNQIKTQTQEIVPPGYRYVSYQISSKKYRIEQQQNQEFSNINSQENFAFQRDYIHEDFRQRNNILLQNNRQRNAPNARSNNFNRLRNPNQNNNFRNWLGSRSLFRLNKKSYAHSMLNYTKKLFQYVRSVQLASWLEYIPFYKHNQTLQSKYKYISLAILNNSINLEASVIKALEYNIPLMQIIMNHKNKNQENIVLNKILKNFAVSHFINQNFVLYGDWNYDEYKQIFKKNQKTNYNSILNSNQNNNQNNQIQRISAQNAQNNSQFQQNGKIVFRKGQNVFAEIDLLYVDSIQHNYFQEKLLQIRDHYYKYKYMNSNPSSSLTNNFKQNSSISLENNQNHEINTPKKDKMTVKEIQQQILKDYLELKRQEDILKIDKDDGFSSSEGSSAFLENSPYASPPRGYNSPSQSYDTPKKSYQSFNKKQRNYGKSQIKRKIIAKQRQKQDYSQKKGRSIFSSKNQEKDQKKWQQEKQEKEEKQQKQENPFQNYEKYEYQ